MSTNMKLETVNIGDVEIFEAGKYNGVEINENDIDETIINFDNKVLEPYINVNHSDKATEQFKDALKSLSLGFASQLRRVGRKLIADFKQVPKLFAELIEAGALKQKSIQFYKKYKHANGKVFQNVLEAVTFHGADGSPAVTTLSDFVRLYKNELNEVNIDNDNEVLELKVKEKNNMEVKNIMDITQEQYNEYIVLKKDNAIKDNEVTELKNKLDVISKENISLKEKADKLADIDTEYKNFKKTVEQNEAAALGKEAKDYVAKQIEDGKIIPASKEMYVKNYISCKNESEDAIALFKKDIEDRGKMILTGAISEGKKTSLKNIDPENDESVMKAINLKRKSGKSFEDARKEVLAEIAAQEEEV